MTLRKRAALTLLAALVLALLFWMWPRSTAPGNTAESGDKLERAGSAPPPPPNLPPSRPVARPKAPAEGAAPLVPIIDEILLEKTEVCEGEENLVTVRAHTAGNQEDSFLHYTIGGETGVSIPVIGSRNPQVMSSYKVSVFGRNNVSALAELPPFTVKDCKAARRLVIEHRVNPNSEAEFSFTAMIRDLGSKKPLKPIRYQWDFGDGSSVETVTPIAVHDFTRRRQDTLYAQLLIRCTAIGADGEKVTGRDSLQLLNVDFESLAYKGIVRLRFDPTPRFPTLGEDGVVMQKVRIWHNSPQPVEIEKVMLLRQLEGSEAPPPEELPVARFLGTTSIPPDGIELAVALDTHAERNVFARTFELTGWSADGFAVSGAFSILKPTALPTKESSQPVADAVLRAKIVRARQLLGQQFVTDEDLWRLEREGAFANLVVDPITGPLPPGPPPPKPIVDPESEEDHRWRQPSQGKSAPAPAPPASETSQSAAGK
jgi:hypothetical protein